MGKKSTIITVIVLILFLVGCSVSEEEELKETKEIFVTGFQSSPLDTNESTEQIAFYLPPSLSITETSKNNIVFSKGKQLYLLFYNPVEGAESKVNMEHDLEYQEEALLFETIEAEGRFGYAMVVPDDNDLHKLIIGIGGRKITTLTTLSDLSESAQDMIQIVNSILYRN